MILGGFRCRRGCWRRRGGRDFEEVDEVGGEARLYCSIFVTIVDVGGEEDASEWLLSDMVG